MISAAVAAAVAALSVVAFPFALVSGDMTYALVWGEQLVEGQLDTFVPGPTPHPLPILLGAALSPLGELTAYRVTDLLLGHLTFGILVGLVFHLASRLGSPLSGAIAASVVLTSTPLLVHDGQAGYDLLFAVCVLAALALDLRESPRGVGPLGFLAVAGLLRPEGWVLAGAYWLLRARGWSWPRRAASAAVVLLAPVAWAAMDAAVTGDPLWSFHSTSEGSRELYGRFSEGDNLLQGARDLIALVGPLAVGVALFGLTELRPGRASPVVAGALAVTLAIFVGLVATGMASNPRYLIVPACLLAVAAGLVPAIPADAGRRRMMGAAAAVVLLVGQGLARSDAPVDVRGDLRASSGWIAEMRQLAGRQGVRDVLTSCPEVAIPSVTMAGYLAHVTGREPASWISDVRGVSEPDAYFSPASRPVAEAFLTRRRFDDDPTFTVPPGMRVRATSGTWTLHVDPRSRCVQAAAVRR